MITQQAQIKVNLPIQLKGYLEIKAGKFGMPMAGYIKYLILKDVSEQEYPVYSASKKTVEAYKQARKEEKKGKLTKFDDLNKLLTDV